MTHLIRSEWIKLRSVRSTVITLLVAGALVVLVAVLAANDLGDDQGETTCVTIEQAEQLPGARVEPSGFCGEGSVLATLPASANLSDLTGGVTFAALIFGVLGVQIIGQEYRFNTIRPTFTAAPRRTRVLLAKLIVITSACAAIAAVMVAFCWVVGNVMLDDFVVDGVDRRIAWGIVLFSVLWTTAGMGVGAIVRQPVAGIMLIAGWSLIAESILQGVVKGSVPWLPFTNGIGMTFRLDGGQPDGLRPLLEGGIYFAVVCGALWAIGAVLVNRRDA